MNAISEIKLYNVPINSTNQFDGFKTKDEQQAWFDSHIVANYVKCNYVARESKIKVRDYVEELQTANYGSYTNVFNGIVKTYYFFILARNFKARKTTELTIAIDTFQTYFFDFKLEQCFVEREHVDSDEIGKNIVPESFELGEYVISDQKIISDYNDICYLLGVSDTEDNNFTGNIYGKVYHGFTLYYYNDSDYAMLTSKIKSICDNGKADSICFIYTFPKKLLLNYDNELESGNTLNSHLFSQKLHENITIDCDKVSFAYRNKSGSYTPKNNKMHTYPFSFIAVKNTSGEVCQLKRELFYGYLGACIFEIDSVVSQNPVITLTPTTYKGEYKSYDNSIELHGFPLCSWNNDNYSNWYAQNSNTLNARKTNAYTTKNASSQIAKNNYNNAINQRKYNTYSDILNIGDNIGNVFTNPVGSVSGAVSDGANAYFNYQKNTSQMDTDIANAMIQNSTTYENEIRNIMAQINDAQILPNTCRGDTTGNGLDICRGSNSFYIDKTTITGEIAKNIDMYFEMFGYEVDEVKTPQFTSREKHNYIKTTNCRITGNIPHDDITVLENLFNNGLQVWHKENSMYIYNADNPIIETIIPSEPSTEA